MKYTKLCKTDIEVSRICVGGMSFGKQVGGGHQWTLDEDATEKMIAHAVEAGVNFIDTANVYADGTSKEFIGKAIKNLGIQRDKIVIATKVFFNEGKLKYVKGEVSETVATSESVEESTYNDKMLETLSLMCFKDARRTHV